ncbi:uncharacterized protein [Amphiura filiformis]|uniref:uncharacterized protein n=1 Tax=Amphiura filiformis TaxID=82378 RepID=UPI003B21429F
MDGQHHRMDWDELLSDSNPGTQPRQMEDVGGVVCHAVPLLTDKGKATVIMEVSEYKDKLSDMLSDARTYEQLASDPTQKYKRELVTILSRLKKEEKITRSQYDLLYPTAENVPRIYGTPKIHKAGNKVRPIVDYTGTIGYQTSRALADILGPLVGGTEHHVNNSKHLAEEMAEVLIEDGEIFNSHDVVSLFNNTNPWK